MSNTDTTTDTSSQAPFPAFRHHIKVTTQVFVTINWDGQKLSITGVECPTLRGDCDRFGQIHDTVRPFNPRLADLWERWHLNDMQPGCEHQRKRPEYEKPAMLELQPLTWGDKYHELRKQAVEGTMAPEDWAKWPATIKAVEALTMGLNKPAHPARWGEQGEQLLAEGLVKLDTNDRNRERHRGANWVSPAEHPDGLLSKPCEVCGYKYGTAWLREDVPVEVLRELHDMGPEAGDDELPRCWRRP